MKLSPNGVAFNLQAKTKGENFMSVRESDYDNYCDRPESDSAVNVEKLVRLPNLKFKIDDRWAKRSWWQRLCARVTAIMIHNAKGDYYQFGGTQGALKPEYLLINADKYQLMHWILREAGYSCCPADVMRRCGINPDVRSA